MRVILYSKPDCPLCDELKGDLAEFQAEISELTERNIRGDNGLSTIATSFRCWTWWEANCSAHWRPAVSAALEHVHRRML